MTDHRTSASSHVSHQSSSAAAQSAPRILVAEDDQLVRSLIERLLVTQGWEVVAVANGVEAVAEWEAQPGFDLGILDVKMPKMNGYDAYLRMRRGAPGARFLFVSGYADEEIEARLVAGEGMPYMAKPFDSDALLNKVSELLASRSGQADQDCAATAGSRQAS